MAQPVVETAQGQVRGSTEGRLHRFFGIPYAAPPTGQRRWQPPQPAQPWSDVRDATAFGAAAPQPQDALALVPMGGVQDEDCLFLNVWTPGTDGRRPVLVWIHGGAFRTGSGGSPLYDGAALATRGDVVVVTVNYRLGALGFLAHPDLRGEDGAAAGNWGLLDQLAALQWVQQNIAAFGGDPANVTVFGESAGSMSVGCLLASGAGRDLFAKAVLQSGAPTVSSLDDAATVAERLVKLAGAGGVADLRELPVSALLDAQQRLDLDSPGMNFVPAVDGALFPRPPQALLADGAGDGVTTVIGTNRDEWKLWAPADPRSRDLDRDGLRRRLAHRLEGDVDTVIEAVGRSRAEAGEPANPNDVWFAAETERVFRVPAMETAAILADRGQPTYAYLFTHRSPAMRGWLGACHALEIPFVFGTVGLPRLQAWTGSGHEVDRLSGWLMDSWLALAHTGDPSTDDLGTWSPYDRGTRPTLVIGADHAMVPAPFDEERAVVAAHLPKGSPA